MRYFPHVLLTALALLAILSNAQAGAVSFQIYCLDENTSQEEFVTERDTAEEAEDYIRRGSKSCRYLEDIEEELVEAEILPSEEENEPIKEE